MALDMNRRQFLKGAALTGAAEKYAMLGKLSNGIRSVGAFFVPLPEGRRAVCVRI